MSIYFLLKKAENAVSKRHVNLVYAGVDIFSQASRRPAPVVLLLFAF